MRFLLPSALCLAFLSVVTPLRAAQADDEVPVLRVVNGRRVWVLPATRIRGERQAPYVFDVPGRTRTLDVSVEPARHDAVRVIDTVRRPPF